MQECEMPCAAHPEVRWKSDHPEQSGPCVIQSQTDSAKQLEGSGDYRLKPWPFFENECTCGDYNSSAFWMS